MNAQFADAFFFIAVLVDTDRAHAPARQIIQLLKNQIITTQWCVIEAVDALCAPTSRTRVIQFFESLASHPLITILPADQPQFDRGWRLYSQRGDKYWSLTDCISFEVMREHGMSEALTGDHHFEQAGFTALLK